MILQVLPSPQHGSMVPKHQPDDICSVTEVGVSGDRKNKSLRWMVFVGFWGYPYDLAGWFQGKSQSKMDDELGVTLWPRKPPCGKWNSMIKWLVLVRNERTSEVKFHEHQLTQCAFYAGNFLEWSQSLVSEPSQQPPATHPATLRLAPVRRKQWIHMNPQYCLVSPWQSPCLTPNAPPWHFRSPGCKMPVAGTRSKTDCSGWTKATEIHRDRNQQEEWV